MVGPTMNGTAAAFDGALAFDWGFELWMVLLIVAGYLLVRLPRPSSFAVTSHVLQKG